MRKMETILNEYANGDLYYRLNLFCQYRSLRGQFAELEKSHQITMKKLGPSYKGVIEYIRQRLIWKHGIKKIASIYIKIIHSSLLT